jgi:hypothetical protein
MKATPLTAQQAVDHLIANPTSDNVMAQNYDPDCPNDADHDPITGECRCWDGLTIEDVATWTENGVVDVAGFAEWGPFALWTNEDDQPASAVDIIADHFATEGERDPMSTYDAAQTLLATLGRAGFVILAPQDIEWGTCRSSDEGHHRVALNLCTWCLEYDPE